MKIRIGFVSNSSSEAFLCCTSLSPEKVEEALREMLDFYNKMMDRDLTFHQVFDVPRILSKKDHEYLKGWSHPFGEDEQDFLQVFIMSKTDNSIPYALFEFIEEKFDARRSHLG